MNGLPSFRYAVSDDTGKILFFIKKLAEHHALAHEVCATEEMLKKWLFENRIAEVVFISVDGEDIGFAMYFYSFSTFIGKVGLYLEDLYISPEYRGRGYGKALLSRLAAVAREHDCGRLEWCCFDFNQSSIDFYLSLGAKRLDDRTVYRLDGEALLKLSELSK